MLVSVPLGLFTAIYTAEYAPKKVRNVVKPLIEVIAGIPTVVFGLFALVTVGPVPARLHRRADRAGQFRLLRDDRRSRDRHPEHAVHLVAGG